MQTLKDKLDFVLQKIERSRIAYSRHQVIKLVAVSKYSEVEKIIELYHCGQRAFGENKVQDLKHKKELLEDLPLEWHFIGHLQTNKINAILDLRPFMIHSIDSFALANEIQKRCVAKDIKVKALLQVNSAGEEHKYGVKPEECVEIYCQIQEKCSHIDLQGLMCMGAHTDKIFEIEKSFNQTKKLFDLLQPQGAKVLSMGMSQDYEIAIANGSNLLRIGSEIFRSSF